jgi:hypothetical protein
VRTGGRTGAAQYQYTLQVDNSEELLAAAPKVFQTLRKLPELADVTSDQQNKGLQASLVIDRVTASRLGITPKLIDDTLYDAFGERRLDDVHAVEPVPRRDDRGPAVRQNPDGLKVIYIKSADGDLSRYPPAKYETTTAPLAVNHQGQFVRDDFLQPSGGCARPRWTRSSAPRRSRFRPHHGTRTAQAFQRRSPTSHPDSRTLLAVYIVLASSTRA